MRGKDLLTSEIKKLESHLQQEIDYYLSEAPIFWPYNHEEAFKQLLILAKEISSEEDDPQVSIHFQKQTSNHLEFIIYIARPKSNLSAKTTITDCCFPLSIQLITHLRKEIGSEIPTMIEAFSLLIPLKKCKQQSSVNLLHTREFIVKLLENVVGVFRDYNGGLFEMQKNRFEELSSLFAEKIPNFSLFAKDLFYALQPIETQMCLTDALFEKLFEGISQVLSKPIPLLNKPNSHVMIFRSQDPDKLLIYSNQVKDLRKRNKITAHTQFRVFSHYYLCLLSSESLLPEVIKEFYHPTLKVENHSVLNLMFQEGEVPALCPTHLFKETRSRTLSKLLFEGLMHMTNENKPTRAGCKEFAISKDKKCYIFKLRPNFWSNGEKVTASHYEKAWKINILKDLELNPFYTIKHEVISTMKNQASLFDLEQEDISLSDIEPDRDLV
ncbi:MAG: hypothetical protein AAF443_02005 [Chlamydiota bacterium]